MKCHGNYKNKKQWDKYKEKEQRRKQRQITYDQGAIIEKEGYTITFKGSGVYEVQHETKGKFKFGNSYLAINTPEEELDKILKLLGEK